MNMFWGVNTIVKGGGEVDDIFGGGCGNRYSHKLDILHMSQ